jgi:hypothetical protein
MKNTVFFLLMLPLSVLAEDLSGLYWSNYACGGYIYYFDSNMGEYKIYTRINVKDKKNGEYTSYQLTEGKMRHKDGATFALTGEGFDEIATVDFSDMENAALKSSQFGLVPLIQCDGNKAKRLIQEAENHFIKCPKNVLNCKGL